MVELIDYVYITGIKYKIVEVEDQFDVDCHFGMIDFKKCVIKINKDMSDDMKIQTLCHEITHGMLVNLGYNDYSNDETFVQSLSSAIFQTFSIKNSASGNELREKSNGYFN